jgi:hypothetical protein
MTRIPTILVIDTTATRGENLCKELSSRLGYEVVYYGSGDFKLFNSGAEQGGLKAEGVVAKKPELCLFHASDHSFYGSSKDLTSVVDSCKTVVLYSGVGILRGDPRVLRGWFTIPRGISGWGSATEGEWRQLANWLSSRASDTEVREKPVLLSVKKEPHFLRAILILCQGFLAAERMPARIPASAVARSRKREWWSVPLLKSAGCNLESVVEQEWGLRPPMPPSLLKLVAWIAGKERIDDAELPEIVEAAKKELECKITR